MWVGEFEKGFLSNETFRDGGLTHNGGGINPSANYEISDLKRFIDRGMKYFRVEAINTNGNT